MKKEIISYQSLQITWILIIPQVIIMLFVLILYWTQAGSKPIPLSMFLIFEVVFFSIGLTFYGMNTTVTNLQVKIEFGVGIIKKSIPIEKIKSTSIVKNKLYQGLGVKKIANGWLYTVKGREAVELQLDDGKVVRIGDSDIPRLQFHINEVLNKDNPIS